MSDSVYQTLFVLSEQDLTFLHDTRIAHLRQYAGSHWASLLLPLQGADVAGYQLYLYWWQVGKPRSQEHAFILSCPSTVSPNAAQKSIVQYDPDCAGYIRFQNL